MHSPPNILHAEFERLVNRHLGRSSSVRVTQVDFYDIPELHAQFKAKREEFNFGGKGTKTVWVFHGTRVENILPIMTGGFKVGGTDGVAVANGRAFGTGVYTAVGPRTPMGYGKGAKQVILTQALVGNVDEDSITPSAHPDWRIYKTKEQLLPRYVQEVIINTNLVQYPLVLVVGTRRNYGSY